MKEKKKKIWLTSEAVDRMLALAKEESQRDYLMMLLMRYGLRCGEITGTDTLRKTPGWRGLPGIHKEDLRLKGIWVKGKGYARGIVQDTLYPLNDDVMIQLRVYAEPLQPSDKLFPISEVHAERLIKKYAQLAGVEDWERIGPHRLRAFFNNDMKRKGIDLGLRKDMMRHKSITTTMIYETGIEFEEKRKILERLDESKQTSS